MTTTPRKIIRLPAVIARVGMARATLYRKIKLKKFPEQVNMDGAVGWFEDEIDGWMAKLSAARPASQPSAGAS